MAGTCEPTRESAANREAGSRKAEDEDSGRAGGDGGLRVVTACDNSCEIVSFIIGVITITVILRVPTAIS